MSSSKLDHVPSLTLTFERERCPYNARQMEDAGKSEAQRRTENSARETGRESFMVKRQQARPVARPSHALAAGPDRAAFNAQWRQEQKSAQEEHVPAKGRNALRAEFKARRSAHTEPQKRSERGQ